MKTRSQTASPYLTEIFYTNAHTKFETFGDLQRHLAPYLYVKPTQIIEDLVPDNITYTIEESESEDSSIDLESTINDSLGFVKDPFRFVKDPLINKPKNDRFSPRKEDGLFWSIYIAKHGVKEFLQIDRYHNTELDEKQKMISAFQKSSATLKTTNIKISNVAIQEIMADLMTNKRTQLQTVIAMAVYYGVEIYLVNEEKRVFQRFAPASFTETAIIYKSTDNYKSSNSQYSVLVDADSVKQSIKAVQETMLELEHGGKYIRGISYYKTDDLEQMSEILGIKFASSKVKKAEMYAKIVETAII